MQVALPDPKPRAGAHLEPPALPEPRAVPPEVAAGPIAEPGSRPAAATATAAAAAAEEPRVRADANREGGATAFWAAAAADCQHRELEVAPLPVRYSEMLLAAT